MKNRFSYVTRSIAFTVCFSFVVNFILDCGSLAIASSSATSSGNAAGQLGQIAESAGPAQSYQTDLFTGRAQTSVPIFVPPGRKNVQPSLSLGYSSSSGNGWLGAGWGMDMGSIQRDTKMGVPKYDSTDKYMFSFQGVSSELISVATNEYRAKDEALFLKFVNDTTNNKWTVTDKSGTVHTFGDASGSRQTNALGTFAWKLSKVKDTSGNYMSITYTTDNGQLYLSTVEYNGNETQSFAHSHKVEFTLESRTDINFSYQSGAKVSTDKRLNNIQVKVKDGAGTYQLARKYVLGYEYSAATMRSRLITVTEYGKDGTTSLPVTTFVYQDKILAFDSMTDKTGIQRINTLTNDDYFVRSVTSSGETLVDLADVNGDGFTDRMQSVSGNTTWNVQYGSSSGFGNLTQFGAPYKPTALSGYDYISWVHTNKEQATDFVDINGDGFADRIIAQDSNTSWIVQLNNQAGAFESSNSSWSNVSRMVANTHYDYIRYSPAVWTTGSETLVDFFDINGDGLPDRVMAEEGNSSWKVQLNTGSGFSSMQTWGTTERLTNIPQRDAIRVVSGNGEVLVDMVDLNGDGLPDRVQADSGYSVWKIQWNTGRGFTTMTGNDWGPIETITSSVFRKYIRSLLTNGAQETDLFDINGDGLPDRVQADTGSSYWKVQYNTGSGFTSIPSGVGEYVPIENMSTPSEDYFYPRRTDFSGIQRVDIVDLDGDGLPDRVQSNSGNTAWKFQKNKGPYPDLLKDIKNGRGGKTTITYGASTAYDNTDLNGKKRLPFPVQVVTQVDQSDSMGNTLTTSYAYKGGMYDASAREFRGFREITVTDAVGTKTISTFDQTATKRGKQLQKEVRDSAGNLFSKEVTAWGESNPYSGVTFTFVTQQDNYIYDGDASYKQTQQTFTYDSYGNLASTTELGDTSISTDSRKTVNTYVYATTPYIVNTLKKTTLYDTDLTTVKAERYFYYDGATSIDTLPTLGRLTKEEEWLSTASGCGAPGVCANNPKTTMTYDSYGNVATVVDARSYTTTNTYDATYKLFLITITNALSQTRQFTYDPWHAQILTSTDQNGQVTETQYDTLGRVTKVISPLDSSAEPTQEFVYTYPSGGCSSNCITSTTTKVKSSEPGQTFTQLITYSFTDGLGREIQRRSPSESGSQQIVSGIVTFNSRGMISQQYVPYFAAQSTSYVAPDTSKPKATFTYDAVGRRTRIDYPDGTNSQVSFSDFVKTTTDQRGKQLRYTNDAYGRLVTTEEFNFGSTYTTTYEYDVLNNLKKTTDNQNNQTTISYDSLSRKIDMIDVDMGTWSYGYDLNDNLISQTDAKSQGGGGSGVITLDASTAISGSGTSITQSHTAASDANGLVVAVKFWDCGGGTSSVSSMTYAGSAMTLANRDTAISGGCGNHAEIWYKTAPATGANNLVINFSSSTGGASGAVVSLKGFKQTNQPHATADSSDHTWCSNPDSTNITIGTSDAWIFDAAQAGSGFGSPSSGQTQLSSITSYKPNVSTGTNSMGWAYTGCGSGSHALAAFVPAPASTQGITFTYDALNRVTLKDLPAGETDVVYQYDTAPTSYTGQTGYWIGRLSKVTDASGTHEFIYDKQGRTLKDKKSVSGTPYEFIRTYDSIGRVRTLTYPDTEVVTYTYNGFGDVETISGLKSSVTTDYVKEVNYNPSGQTTFVKYGNNVTSDYTFNANTLRLSNILTKKPDGTTKLQDLTYTFDGNGNVATIADTVNSMSQSFTYDDLNRLTQAIGSAYGTQTFTYDSIGNMTNKAGRAMSYGAGATGPHAVTEITWTGSNYPTFCRDYASGDCDMAYDANGNMTVRGQDVLTYDSENRLIDMKVREGSSGTTNYTLKANSWNVISFTHLPNDKSVSNVLSGLTFGTDYNQVSTWDSSSGTWKHWVNDSQFNDFTEFQYGKTYEIYKNTSVDKAFSVTGITNGADLTHNLLTGDNFVSPAVKSATNVTTVLAGLTQGTHYSDVKRYNATTQVWESYVGGAFTQFEPGKGYNIIGLTSCAFSYGKTETQTTFVYDSTGQRVKKTTGGTTTTYLGKDYDVTGATSTKYIFLGDRRISTKDSTGTLQFIHDDHISNSNIITDSSGNQAGKLEYDPYGSTVTQTGSANPKHKFTSQESDDSTKLYYYNARYYDPQLGRFITPDTFVQNPADPQSFNRYAYCRNNPIKFTDPTGHFWGIFVAIAKIASIIAGVTAAASQVASMLGATKLANSLAKISQIASYVAIAANAAGAAFAPPGTPEGAIKLSINQNKEIQAVVTEGGKQAAKDGTREAFREKFVGELRGQINGAVEGLITSSLFSSTAHAAENSPSSTQSEQVTLTILSRPTDRFNGKYDHLMAYNQSTGAMMELLPEGTNVIHNSVARTQANQTYAEKMKGGLNVTVDKSRLDAAFNNLKQRYSGKIYNPYDNSNNFIINLLKESGRPLTPDELQELDVTRQIWGFLGIILSPIQELMAHRYHSPSENRFSSITERIGTKLPYEYSRNTKKLNR